MSSSYVSASSQLDTYIDGMQPGDTLRVNAFEFWHARCPSRLVWLAEDVICEPASEDRVERIFSLCGLLCSRRRSAICQDDSLSYTQPESAERNFLSTVTVFKSLGVNVTDLCRNSLAEKN